MLDGEVRSASVEALVDGELLALPASEVRALLARHPEITVKLVAALVRRLRTANERISRQSFQTVPSRVAGVLSQLVAEEAPARRASAGEVTIRMNQADLAQLAGTSRESVSRFLADLERAGIVRPGRGRVTVLDPPKAPQLHLLGAIDDATSPVRCARRGWSSASCAGAGSTTSGCWRRWGRCPARISCRTRLRRRAYADSALPIGEGQTISQPWIVAAICQALELSGDERVLEVGTGSRLLGLRPRAASPPR